MPFLPNLPFRRSLPSYPSIKFSPLNFVTAISLDASAPIADSRGLYLHRIMQRLHQRFGRNSAGSATAPQTPAPEDDTTAPPQAHTAADDTTTATQTPTLPPDDTPTPSEAPTSFPDDISTTTPQEVSIPTPHIQIEASETASPVSPEVNVSPPDASSPNVPLSVPKRIDPSPSSSTATLIPSPFPLHKSSNMLTANHHTGTLDKQVDIAAQDNMLGIDTSGGEMVTNTIDNSVQDTLPLIKFDDQNDAVGPKNDIGNGNELNNNGNDSAIAGGSDRAQANTATQDNTLVADAPSFGATSPSYPPLSSPLFPIPGSTSPLPALQTDHQPPAIEPVDSEDLALSNANASNGSTRTELNAFAPQEGFGMESSAFPPVEQAGSEASDEQSQDRRKMERVLEGSQTSNGSDVVSGGTEPDRHANQKSIGKAPVDNGHKPLWLKRNVNHHPNSHRLPEQPHEAPCEPLKHPHQRPKAPPQPIQPQAHVSPGFYPSHPPGIPKNAKVERHGPHWKQANIQQQPVLPHVPNNYTEPLPRVEPVPLFLPLPPNVPPPVPPAINHQYGQRDMDLHLPRIALPLQQDVGHVEPHHETPMEIDEMFGRNDDSDPSAAISTLAGVPCLQFSPDPAGFAEDTPVLSLDAKRVVVMKILSHGGDKFTITGLLGEGAFGKVISAHNNRLGDVAIKVLNKKQLLEKCGESAEAEVRLERDIMIQASMQSLSGMVPLLASWEDDCNYYLVMRLYYTTLSQVLKDGTPLDSETIKYWFAQMLVGFQQMRGINIMHRDIKPDNILLPPSGHPKISDFGLALQPTDERDKIEHIPIHDCCGTVGYQAPEVADYITKRIPYRYDADIYSLGVTWMEVERARLGFRERWLRGMDSLDAELNAKYGVFPLNVIEDPDLRRLLGKMLDRHRPINRPTIEALKADPYFYGIDWKKIEHCEFTPSFRPEAPKLEFDSITLQGLNIEGLEKYNSLIVDQNGLLQIREYKHDPDYVRNFSWQCPKWCERDITHDDSTWFHVEARTRFLLKLYLIILFFISFGLVQWLQYIITA